MKTEPPSTNRIPVNGGTTGLSPRPLLAAVFLAVCFWGWIFGLPWGNFWWKMTAAAVVLSSFSLWYNRGALVHDYRVSLRHLGAGLLSAVLLYLIFWFGGELLQLLFPASGEKIGAVYATKSQLPHWLIAVLLVGIIAPAEEIFWRGFIQKRLVAATSPRFGLLLATSIYTLVHLWAGNPVLLLAAFVCGLIWGWLYQRSGSLSGPIFSHVLWDVSIFILLPLG